MAKLRRGVGLVEYIGEGGGGLLQLLKRFFGSSKET